MSYSELCNFVELLYSAHRIASTWSSGMAKFSFVWSDPRSRRGVIDAYTASDKHPAPKGSVHTRLRSYRVCTDAAEGSWILSHSCLYMHVHVHVHGDHACMHEWKGTVLFRLAVREYEYSRDRISQWYCRGIDMTTLIGYFVHVSIMF